MIATLLLAPLTVPGIALGLAIYVALVAIDEQFGSALTGSMVGLVLAHIMITTPWVVRLCLASLTNHDRAAEEAAASLGAGPLTVIWRVTLPAMRAGIIAAALFAFVISFENLELALFLTSPGVTTLPVAVLQYLEYHIDPLVSAVAVAQIVVRGRAAAAARSLRPAGPGGAMTAAALALDAARASSSARTPRWMLSAWTCAPGETDRAARPVRLRQDHDAAHDRRLRAADAPATSGSTAPASPRCRRTGARWASCSRATRCSRI